MSRSARSFTSAEVRIAIKAVESVGKCIAAVDFPKEGGFRLLLGEPSEVAPIRRSGANEWDEVLAT
jgi:hypothetical protein